VRYPDQILKERDAQFEGMTFLKSLDYITRDINPTGDREGVVDMTKYKLWLHANYDLNFQ
jgi:hypothetical protein